jgi:ABC-type transporter Mla subunit MlaD
MRVPERERLRLIVNELGAGLAGNGAELRAAVRRANPALQQADRVVSVLAEQDRLLARLVDDSDRALAPLAERRRSLGRFVDAAGRSAGAAADRGDDLERDLEKLPAFLRELRPAAERIAGLAEQAEPALASLGAQAPAINASIERLGPFSTAATPALTSLGRVAGRGRRTFPRIEAIVRQLGELGAPLNPLATDLAELAGSFDEAGGIEDVMRFVYFFAGATNGFDEIGHYVRSSFSVGACSARISDPSPGCESTFDRSGEASTAALDYLLGSDAP